VEEAGGGAAVSGRSSGRGRPRGRQRPARALLIAPEREAPAASPRRRAEPGALTARTGAHEATRDHHEVGSGPRRAEEPRDAKRAGVGPSALRLWKRVEGRERAHRAHAFFNLFHVFAGPEFVERCIFARKIESVERSSSTQILN
jgi:hypothetical protein